MPKHLEGTWDELANWFFLTVTPLEGPGSDKAVRLITFPVTYPDKSPRPTEASKSYNVKIWAEDRRTVPLVDPRER